jgi:ubiquinone biosynthesis protein
MRDNLTPDAPLLTQLLTLLPARHAAALMALAAQENVTGAQWETIIREALEQLEEERQRQLLGSLLSRLFPLETLVPAVYSAWRPLVREAVAFLGARLSPQRLAPKLVAQLLSPPELPLVQRLMLFLAQMPSLQKLGQVVARNRHLDPALRTQLTQLETAIHDFSATAARTEIMRQLGPQLAASHVEIEKSSLAEGSVSVVLRFTWVNPATGQRERGVFKVLKPYVRAYLTEELALLHEFADFLDAQRLISALMHVQVREVFEDIRRLLAEESNFPQEQANLRAATRRYANVPGVRAPRLLPALCTPTITAMTEEHGVKVTEAFAGAPWKRRAVAERLIAALIAVPLFAPEEQAVFHADPHAGNLFCDETTGEVILFDWALTERLTYVERRQVVLLLLAIAFRDEHAIVDAINALSADDLIHHQAKAASVRRQVKRFLQQFSPFAIPRIEHALTLLDHLAFSGIRFSPALTIFRKVLFTVEGILHAVAPGIRIDIVLAWHVVTNAITTACPLYSMGVPRNTYRLPITISDWLMLQRSALTFGWRLWRRVAEHRTPSGRCWPTSSIRVFTSTLLARTAGSYGGC